MDTYGVIMAGGGGTRFWPLSKKSLPKQFLNLTGKDIMVNETIDRLGDVIPADKFFVITNEMHVEMTRNMTAGRMPDDHVLGEPAARNTAACIGYAAMEILNKYGDGIMCVFPADHYIQQEEEFQKVISHAIRLADQEDKLVTIGIRPTFPSTGYGYIKWEKEGSLAVEEFVEKPDLDTATAYLESGKYLWNSGMFIWKASVILDRFKSLLPDIYACLEKIGNAMGSSQEQKVIQEVYPTIPRISIDYGIMERSSDVLMLEGNFGWNDVGSWDTLPALYQADEHGNVINGKFAGIDTRDCIVYAQDKLVATIGLKDVIVVQTSDSILVCDKRRSQDVKKIVEMLEEDDRTEYL